MAKVITLSGIAQAANVPWQYRACTPVEVFSPPLNQNVTVCREALPPNTPTTVVPAAPMPMPKKRGRPRGSRPGAPDKKGRPIQKPKFPSCSRYEWVRTKKGQRCKCTQGQGKYAPNDMCRKGSNNAG